MFRIRESIMGSGSLPALAIAAAILGNQTVSAVPKQAHPAQLQAAPASRVFERPRNPCLLEPAVPAVMRSWGARSPRVCVLGRVSP